MLKKICNSLAVISVAVLVCVNLIVADTAAASSKNIRVDESKEFNFYNGSLLNGGKDTYTVNVESGKEAKIVIRAEKGVALKIQSPDGSTQSHPQEKYFSIELKTSGEYTLDVEALAMCRYTLEVTNR